MSADPLMPEVMHEVMHEARLWESLKNGSGGDKDKGKGKVKCNLCNFRCIIAEGKRGVCGVRENRGGTLYSLNYGRLIAQSVDPVEKKPFFHFQPGSLSYSIATVGCNFRCLHCQNADISQMPRESGDIMGNVVPFGDVVQGALDSGCKNISYTYTEPTIFFEYAQDCARLASEKGLKNVFVTNGYMTPECLAELDGTLHAANVDVKSSSESFYKLVCGARLKPVLESVEEMLKLGIWVEVTTLIIPGHNDSEKDLRGVAGWLASLDKAVPWHISAFYPTYKLLDAPPTPVSTLNMAREIGFSEGLRYVYTGNVPSGPGDDTFCYDCKETLIKRRGFSVRKNRLKEGKCPACGAVIDGVWD